MAQMSPPNPSASVHPAPTGSSSISMLQETAPFCSRRCTNFLPRIRSGPTSLSLLLRPNRPAGSTRRQELHLQSQSTHQTDHFAANPRSAESEGWRTHRLAGSTTPSGSIDECGGRGLPDRRKRFKFDVRPTCRLSEFRRLTWYGHVPDALIGPSSIPRPAPL